MPQLTSPLSTPTGMPATNQAHLGKLAGTRIHFGTFADFTAAITTGTAFYAADLWSDGQEMTIASEADSGAVRVWRTALGHARTVRVRRLEVVLPANTNVVLAAAGIPAAGTGTNGDLSVDKAAGIAYLKTAGAWASAGNIGELSAAAASAVQSAFNAGSSFTSTTLGPATSKLQVSLDAAFGTLSFSRSSANASVVDCYGSLQFVNSGEARFFGARRTENVITDTESLSSGWTLGSAPTSTKTASTRKSPNHGRPSMWSIARPSGNSNMLVLNSRSYRPGKWCLSAWVVADGATTITIRIERSSDSVGTGQSVTPAAGVPTRIAVTHDIVDTSNHRGWISVTTSGAATFEMGDPQMEWVHGQSSPAPSDYVPRGVSTALLPASAYSSEAGVDGVRYHDTLNPWTLASGIATRSTTEVAIDPARLIGIAIASASATNQLYSSGNISAAEWTKTSTVNATPADSTLLGKNSLWKLEQAAATQGHRVGQSWRGAAPAVNTVIHATTWAKAGDAACPYIYLAVRQLDGSTFKYAWFNLHTGTLGAVSSGAEAYMFREGDLWCCNILLQSGASGSTAPVLWLGVTQTSNADNVAGTLGNGSWIGAVQMDRGLPTSYIGDTTSSASLTRSAEILSAVSTGMPAINWTLSADLTCRFRTDTALKPTWLYGISTYASAADRGAFGWRPAAFGGFYDGGEDEIFWDMYPGISADNLNWDGIHLKSGSSAAIITARAMETYKYQWALAADARQADGGNQTGAVGSALGTSVGNDNPRPAINSWSTTPRTWYVGRKDSGTSQIGELYCANLTRYPYALTAAQMQLA